MVRPIFRCDQCGECCRNIGALEFLSDLDNGVGICKYLDGNKCSIYEERPIVCRVDECYELYYKGKCRREEFYEINYSICEMLKSRKNYLSRQI